MHLTTAPDSTSWEPENRWYGNNDDQYGLDSLYSFVYTNFANMDYLVIDKLLEKVFVIN